MVEQGSVLDHIQDVIAPKFAALAMRVGRALLLKWSIVGVKTQNGGHSVVKPKDPPVYQFVLL